MDILTHTISGVAVGTVVSSFSNNGFKDKFRIVLACGIAGALPDIDAISLWSGFDSTIGEFFNLENSGKEIYSAKLWYSHHAFMHSVMAGLILAGIIGLFVYLFGSNFRDLKYSELINSLRRQSLLLIGFSLAFFIHLIEDMPTPASSWEGVNLFWPNKSYYGGTGDIWWWNNYDIFLIVIGVVIINWFLALIKRVIFIDIRKFTVGVFLIGFILGTIQIKTRDFDFSYSGSTNKYQEFEMKSKELQKEILGDDLFQLMEKMDDKLKIYF